MNSKKPKEHKVWQRKERKKGEMRIKIKEEKAGKSREEKTALLKRHHPYGRK